MMTWQEERRAYPWRLVVAPGCHRQPENPEISRHRTLLAAVRAARRSDRTRVEHATTSLWGWQPASNGRGLYGSPSRRPLSEDLAAARRSAIAAGLLPMTPVLED
jgi:hypothetical protein